MSDNLDESFAQSFDASEWARAFVEHVSKDPTIATDEATMIGWFATALMRGHDEHASSCVSPSEAIYGFAGWLTTRPRTLTVGASENAAPVAEAVDQFCRWHAFESPRQGWENKLAARRI